VLMPVCGINGLVYISGVELGEANAWSIAVKTNKSKFATFNSSWKKLHYGPSEWSGSIGGYHEQGSKRLQDAALARVSVALLIYPKRTDLTTYYSGNAGFDFDSGGEAEGGGPVTCSATFEGDSTLMRAWTEYLWAEDGSNILTEADDSLLTSFYG